MFVFSEMGSVFTELLSLDSVILIVSAFFTSMISAVLGMGGGVTLLTVMMMFLPVQILIPIHGLIQFFSNGFRVALNFKHLKWDLIIPIVSGGVFGALLGSQVVFAVPTEVYRPLLAVFILFVTWRPKQKKTQKIFKFKFYIVGFFSHFMSLVFGATGPFLAPFFIGEELTRHQIIATKAAAQVTGHLFKLFVYFSMGFQLGQYMPLVVVMVFAVLVGTYVGKRALDRVPERLFLILFKGLITLLCLKMIVGVMI